MGGRRENRAVASSVITTSPFWLRTSKRNLMAPRSGLLREGVMEITSTRTESSSPGRTGSTQRSSSSPGEPRLWDFPSTPSTIRRWQMEAVCQPLATIPPKMERRPASSSR